MPFLPDLSLFRRRLAQTIAWCRPRAAISDPRNSLRTPALRPANLSSTPDRWGTPDYDWGTYEDSTTAVSTVEALAQTRAQLLRQRQHVSDTEVLPPDLAGGRLLIADPLDSDQCGLSVEEALGFIDEVDVPAWDTWVCYISEATTPDPEAVRRTQAQYRAYYNKARAPDFVDWQPRPHVSYLLCWIPPQFLSLVDEGIQVNPVECFFWAVEYKQRHYNTELLRQLDAEGLLT